MSSDWRPSARQCQAMSVKVEKQTSSEMHSQLYSLDGLIANYMLTPKKHNSPRVIYFDRDRCWFAYLGYQAYRYSYSHYS